MKFNCFIVVLLFISAKLTFAETPRYFVLNSNNQLVEISAINYENNIELSTLNYCQSKDTLQVNKSTQKRKKIINGLLSFPFPLGFLGAHRIMLGTKPWVPIVYVATFGGCFGLLPLVDFCVLMFADNVEQYENNPNVFMWIK